MKAFDLASLVLVVVGAVNWGLVGLARLDLVAALFGMSFGETNGLTSAVYALVGAAGLYQAMFFKGIQHRWSAPSSLATAR